MLGALATAASGVARLIKLLGQRSNRWFDPEFLHIGYVLRYYVAGFNRRYLLGCIARPRRSKRCVFFPITYPSNGSYPY
jgi:hypothetical protein